MNWLDPQPLEIPEALREAVGGHPLVAATLVRRGITTPAAARAFLDPSYYTPAPPAELPDLLPAAERVESAIRRGERIAVWGDFDVDGQTATALLLDVLRKLGADAVYHIPRRMPEGHGVKIPALEKLLAQGVGLLITCDTGVADHQAVLYAQQHGVDVIITDHHDLPAELPPAFAVVEPKRLAQGHPLYELAGVGCAFKLAEELYGRAGLEGDTERLLDLVALGTVVDVAVLSGDNRYLVQRGLAILRRAGRIGLLALSEAAELRPAGLSEEHLAFHLGPRLNALGRLDDARAGVELLTTGDLARARILAAQLEGLNDQRRLISSQMLAAAQEQLAADPTLLDYEALVLAHPAWHPGVVGVIAGRLAELYRRPAVVIAIPGDGPGRGSARSVPGCDIHAALASQSELLTAFGGHPMAAGLLIEPELIPRFRRGLSRAVAGLWDRAAQPPTLPIDAYMPLDALSLELVAEIERLAPFGPGNPPLLLASRNLTLLSQATLGRGGEHLRLTVKDEQEKTQTVIWWQGAGQPLLQGRFDLAYTARASDFRGEQRLQLEWIAYREREPVVLEREVPAIKVLDYRALSNSLLVLEGLLRREAVQVWVEGAVPPAPPGKGRRSLEPAPALAIWTAPPGPAVLAGALERAAPATVYLFGLDPGLDRPRAFLERLAGLVKHALSTHGGRVELAALAEELAHREETVRLGLRWLAARGQIAMTDEAEGVVVLAPGAGESGPELSQAEERLRQALAETAAYRRYFATAPPETLLSR
jgi:single-stranded-DNA-specific exonuclease